MKKMLLTLTATAALSVAPVFAQTTTTAPQPTTPPPTYAPAPAPAPEHEEERSGGFFFEPMVTWESGSGDISNAEAETDGFGAGLRLGGHVNEWMFIAADGRYSFPSYDLAGFGDVDAEAWNVGATLGFQMPWFVGLRAWGSWVFAGELDPDSQGLVDASFEGGTGWRVGAGFKLAFASLNVEYQDLTYDEVSSNSGIFAGSTIGGIEQDQQTWVWSVSFPFSM